MKALLGTFVLTLIVSITVFAQDSAMPSQSAANGSATMSQAAMRCIGWRCVVVRLNARSMGRCRNSKRSQR
jgi:hypothetical protein